MNTLCNSFFYWDAVNNCMDITAPGYNDVHVENSDPISRILVKREIPADDILPMERTRDKILYGTTVPIEDKTVSAKFRIIDEEHSDPNTAPWYKLIFYLNKNGQGLVTETSAILRKMTDNEIMDKEILEAFSNDRNPRIFNSRIQKLLNLYPDENFAFIQFDIKNFKFINEKYGDEFGNEILNNIRNVLEYYSSSTFISSRLSADVFMFITTYENKQEVIDFIQNLDSQINNYRDISFRVCYGINFVQDKSLPARSNGDYAAIARMSAKEDALSKYKIYDDTQLETRRHKKLLEEDMRSALDNNEFVMFLQPKYDIETRQVIGAEALARWIKPDGTIVSPIDFIPFAEENGFIKEIDHFIWGQACKTIREWINSGKTPIPISINVSRVHLSDFNFIDILNNIVDGYNVPKKLLGIEITETLQNDNTDASILALKDNGFILLMDDFGSGYSSLKMINSTPFDILKIDRSFLADFMVSERGKKIISHTIDLSQDIGIELIAEGVENQYQEDFLLSNGCRYAQGFLFSRPIPVAEFNEKYI